jgi:hypothetical protein
MCKLTCRPFQLRKHVHRVEAEIVDQ